MSSTIPHPPAPTTTGNLPREIIRWIQTLQLSKPLKHPKRDFANGFVVAEIASRFIPTVEMNLFDNVVSSTKKLENWKALQKCLAKGGAPQIPEQLVQDVLAAKDGAGDELLLMLYTQFAQRGLPGSSAQKGGNGAMAPEPQALEHVPSFTRNVPNSDGTSGANNASVGQHQFSEATRQLSAMAAEQLRAAELELMKQRDETDLKNKILGFDEGKDESTADGSKLDGKAANDAARAALAAQQQAQKARLLRQPAVPQTVAQGQIRAIDVNAEKQEKAVLFNNVSVRQLSGAALQRFGFHDRQSPSARGGNANSSPLKSQQRAGAGGSGRGGVGASIHLHLCNLLDRFAAEYMSSMTTWNPPADSSPLSYFIENCSNPNVISPSFKANAWAFLHAEAFNTAMVLASAPIDTLFFVAHFANVNIETTSAPRPGDPSFADYSKPKFFGTDAFDATYYCHVVLGALHDYKRAAAEVILRRYAFPAILPVIFRRLDASQQQGISASSQLKSAGFSLRRALFALSGLVMGNLQPHGTIALASCLKFCFVPQHSHDTTLSAVDAKNDNNSAFLEENTVQIHHFIEVIYDSLLTNFEATVAYSTKLFNPDTCPILVVPDNSSDASPVVVTAVDRDIEFFNALDVLCASIRGDLTSDKLVPTDLAFPESVALLVLHNIERGFADASSSVQEAALRSLIAVVQAFDASSPFDTIPELFAVVASQLRNGLLPALTEPKSVHGTSASGSMLMELMRLLCVSLRCVGSGGNNNNSAFILSIAAECVTSLHPLALRDTERLALLSALASGLSNYDVQLPNNNSFNPASSTRNNNISNNNNNQSEALTKITLSGTGNGSSAVLLDEAQQHNNNSNHNNNNNNNNNNHGQDNQQQQQDFAEKQIRTNISIIINFCVETLAALPPNVLETFANTGGSIVKSLPSIIAAPSDRLAFAAPMDFSRWNITALGFGIASRFTNISLTNAAVAPVPPPTPPTAADGMASSQSMIIGGSNSSASSSQQQQLKIVSASKVGSAGVLKLPTPPSPQAKPQEFAKFITPYKMIILLFTVFLAKQNSASSSSSPRSSNNNGDDSNFESANLTSASILRPARSNEDNVLWWATLSAGFANELKKLLLYYDAARKGPASLAPRKDAESESFHEIYVQTGRAALFIVTKLYADISNALPSSVAAGIPAMLLSTASRVSLPASKIADDDQVIGQTGLEVAGKAIEWLMTSGVISASRENAVSGSARSESSASHYH